MFYAKLYARFYKLLVLHQEPSLFLLLAIIKHWKISLHAFFFESGGGDRLKADIVGKGL